MIHRRLLSGHRILILKRILILTGMAALLVALLPAEAALADTPGRMPNQGINCGALRDIPNQWIVHSGGYCSGWTYSYVFTSPSIQHYAIWPIDIEQIIGPETYQVEAWIPSFGAGQHTAYYYQLCGSASWNYIGQLFQQQDSGWYTPGSFVLNSGDTLCAIREQNTGNQSWDMAEDALGLYS